MKLTRRAQAGQRIKYATVCSGIEAPSVAWEPLDWTPAWFSEIGPFCSALLETRYPDVPNLGDMEGLLDENPEPVDLLCGGTPCQSFSVAGLRGGMDDPRGNLAAVFCALAGKLRPRWVVWENVPGVLSSNAGRDFGAILGALAEFGYGLAWRVLDAQYFGVPQRRRRVFVIGYLGDWRGAAAVLFDSQSLRGNSPPGGKTGEDITGTLESRAGRSDFGTDFSVAGGLQVAPVANTLTRRTYKGINSNVCEGQTMIVHTLRGEGHDASEDGTGRGTPLVVHGTQDPCVSDKAFSLQQNSGQENATFTERSGVRRLTPRECERLQGFPDNYTLIEHRGKPASDTARYKAIGNSMAVPVMRWIGRRLAFVDGCRGGI